MAMGGGGYVADTVSTQKAFTESCSQEAGSFSFLLRRFLVLYQIATRARLSFCIFQLSEILEGPEEYLP